MVATPPVWTDPATGTVDVANGGIWTAAAIDAICSDLKALGGGDGASGLAGKVNLLVNGGMEVWQRGTSFSAITGGYTADRWTFVAGGTSSANVTKDTTNIAGASTAAMAVAYTHNAASYLNQRVENGQMFAGLPVSLAAWVKCSTANAAMVTIYDGTQNISSAFHPGDGVYRLLTVTGTLAVNASQLAVELNLTASCTAIIDSVMLVAGVACPGYVALPYDLDLLRCLRYYEIVGQGANTVALAGYAAAAAQPAYATIGWKAQKAVVPTISLITANFALTNCAAPAVNGVDQTAVCLKTTANAAGSFSAINTAGQALSASADV